MASVDSPEMVEQLDEKLAVPAPPTHPVEASRLEVERPGNPHLAVGAGGREGSLSPFSHPAKAHLGIRLQLGYTSWKKGAASSSVIFQTSPSLSRLSSICSGESLSGPTGRGLHQRYSRRWSARRTLSRLAEASLSLISCKEMSLQLQRERSQPCSTGDCSSMSLSMRSPSSLPINGLGPRLRRSSNTARPSRMKRDATA